MTRARRCTSWSRTGSTTRCGPSGGNTYDRRLCRGRWPARLVGAHARGRRVPGRGRGDGGTPRARAGLRAPAGRLARCWSTAWSPRRSRRSWCPRRDRLRLVVLMHMPLGVEAAASSARGARACVLAPRRRSSPPSSWSRRWLLATYGLDPARVHVAQPGVDAAAPAVGTADGGALLCVGAVTPGKGHDVLLAALARVADLPGAARASAPWRWRRTSSPGCGAAPGRRPRRPGRARPARARRRELDGGVRRGGPAGARQPRRRPTAWSSPRRWPAGCRWSPPTSAVCPRRSASTADGRTPGPAGPAR